MKSKKFHIDHPCAEKFVRINLPVAGDCNIGCNYCCRKFDCVNESRPGIVSKLLSPIEALDLCMQARKRIENLTVVGIAGPGDSLAPASVENTLETLRLVRKSWNEAVFCLSTNGLALPDYAKTLFNAGVLHITVTINSLQPSIAKRIYRYIDYAGERLMGEEAAETLIKCQIEGIRAISELGIMCKVNTILIKGLNDGEMTKIAEAVKKAGASLMNIMRLMQFWSFLHH